MEQPNWAQYSCDLFTGNIAPAQLMRAPVDTVAVYTVEKEDTAKAQRAVSGYAQTARARIRQELIHGFTVANEVRCFIQVTILVTGRPFKHKKLMALQAPEPCDGG